MNYRELRQNPTLTVGQLIDKLSKYDADTKVAVFSDVSGLNPEETTDDLEYDGDDVGAHNIKAIHDSWHFSTPHDTVCIEISRDTFIGHG